MAEGIISDSSFDAYKTSEQVKEYFLRALTRPQYKRSKAESFLYRYTKIQYLLEMLNSGYMILNSCEEMNDRFETALLEKHRKSHRVFFACFTKASESLAMYRLYGMGPDSIIFRISYLNLQRIVDMNVTSDTGKYSPTHECVIYRNYTPTQETTSGKIFCTNVGYVDPITSSIQSGTVENTNINAPFLEAHLAGKIKYNCWSYEDEIRLCAELSEDLRTKECVGIKLPDDFSDGIEVILGPGFDADNNQNLLTDLHLRSIPVSQSIYESIYKDLFINK